MFLNGNVSFTYKTSDNDQYSMGIVRLIHFQISYIDNATDHDFNTTTR